MQTKCDVLKSFPSGAGLLLEGKLLDVSRHSISDVKGQKVTTATTLYFLLIQP